MRHVERIVLIGFSGTGKSTVARLVADRLGWDLVDTDAEIEAASAMSITQFFERRGEAAFRAVERDHVGASLKRRGVVVATGGGAVVNPDVWSSDLLGRPGTLVVALDARPTTILQRLREHRSSAGDAADRPLLASDDPLGRIAELKTSRQHAYDRASITLVTDACSTNDVAAELTMLARRNGSDDHPDLRLETSSGVSSIHVAPRVSLRIGPLLRAHLPTPPRAWIVSDDAVGPLHAPGVRQAIEQAGVAADVKMMPAGEGSKSLRGATVLYDWLLDAGIERGDVVVAVGGGMVGDLAGFVAATCLRGVGLIQVPTTLLAMVDSSVGGKTGINHRTGKNLIGAFYQPPLVLIDPMFLRTLPARELTSGWAEIVKHAIIQPSTPDGERGDLATFLHRNADRLLALDEPATSYLIRRNVALKAAVVAADERESGLRAYLNFGHTLGHAIEAAGYRLLHGEAVAVGMRAAARLGATIGTCGAEEVGLIDGLLDRFGLPSTADLDEDSVLSLLGNDKKRVSGQQRWVLPLAGGGVCLRHDVTLAAVRSALAAVSNR